MSARRLTLIFCLAEICSMTGFATFAALLPGFVAEWNLSGTQAGWINGIFFAGYVAAVPFLVSLTDRRDPRHVYLAAAAITVVSSLGFAIFAEPGGRQGARPADPVRARGELAQQRDAVAPRARQLMPAHERREVHVPLVGRRVGAVVVAELAVVTELVDLLEAPHAHARDLLRRGVHQVEQPGEGRAEREAAPALVADLAHPAQLPLDGLRVEVVGVLVPELRGRTLRRRHLHPASGGGTFTTLS